MNTYCPLVEKYRPTKFQNIILDTINNTIIKNMINNSIFPNILFYGPPGTGKTTTIINLIKEYQTKHGWSTLNSVIHLNASDDRGIEIIRNQIYNFVISNKLFETGLKFVILDEADYMTKPAQYALKYILQHYAAQVRVCILCNYISKIEEGLLNEFVIFRFNKLPEDHITNMLTDIVIKEEIPITTDHIMAIQQLYKSDLRSMINCIQLHKSGHMNIINKPQIEYIYNLFVQKYPITQIINEFGKIEYDIKSIMKYFFNYIIHNKPEKVTLELMSVILNTMRFQECNNKYFIIYCITKLYNKL
jgi:replication factor C subunit 3/5